MKNFLTKLTTLLVVLISAFVFQHCGSDDVAPKKEDLLSLTSISPENGTSGTTVTITGTGFSSTLSNNLVTLNDKPCTVTNATTTELTITIPADAGTGKIKVTINNKVVESSLFTYTTTNTLCSPDNTFGINGKVYTAKEYDLLYTALALQADNKIIAVGYKSPKATETNTIFVTRRLSNGALDTNFKTTGILQTNFGSVYEFCHTTQLDASGNILIAGSSNGTYALARLLPTGEFDNTFSDDGKQTMSFGVDYGSSIKKLLIQPDGKIVAIGEAYGGSSFEFSVARFNADGTPDNTFSEDGKTIIPIGNLNDFGHDAVLQSDGKIVIVGRTTNTTTFEFSAALVRLNANGTLDNTFGTGGKVVTLVNAYTIAEAVALDANGKIVMTGHSDGSMITLRYNTNGTLDNTFGGQGYTITNFNGFGNSKAYAITINGEGKVIVGGFGIETGMNVYGHFAIARYNSNGSLDNTFNGNGKMVTIMGSYESVAYDMLIQPDNKLLLGGYSANTQGGVIEFALLRLESACQ